MPQACKDIASMVDGKSVKISEMFELEHTSVVLPSHAGPQKHLREPPVKFRETKLSRPVLERPANEVGEFRFRCALGEAFKRQV